MPRYKTRMRRGAPVGRPVGNAPRRQSKAPKRPQPAQPFGYPAGAIYPCRMQAARAGFGIIPSETEDDE